MYSIRYADRAIKSLKRIPQKWQKRILKAVDGLKLDPFAGKNLQGDMSGICSLRIWPYRVLYIVKKKEVVIVILDIGHRQNVYK